LTFEDNEELKESLVKLDFDIASDCIEIIEKAKTLGWHKL